jgi:hypothetical protein
LAGALECEGKGKYRASSFLATQGSFNHNMSPKRRFAAESSVHQVPYETVTLDADDFLLELEVGLEFAPLVPEPEELPEVVIWPAISGGGKKRG